MAFATIEILGGHVCTKVSIKPIPDRDLAQELPL